MDIIKQKLISTMYGTFNVLIFFLKKSFKLHILSHWNACIHDQSSKEFFFTSSFIGYACIYIGLTGHAKPKATSICFCMIKMNCVNCNVTETCTMS